MKFVSCHVRKNLFFFESSWSRKVINAQVIRFANITSFSYQHFFGLFMSPIANKRTMLIGYFILSGGKRGSSACGCLREILLINCRYYTRIKNTTSTSALYRKLLLSMQNYFISFPSLCLPCCGGFLIYDNNQASRLWRQSINRLEVDKKGFTKFNFIQHDR